MIDLAAEMLIPGTGLLAPFCGTKYYNRATVSDLGSLNNLLELLGKGWSECQGGG